MLFDIRAVTAEGQLCKILGDSELSGANRPMDEALSRWRAVQKSSATFGWMLSTLLKQITNKSCCDNLGNREPHITANAVKMTDTVKITTTTRWV